MRYVYNGISIKIPSRVKVSTRSIFFLYVFYVVVDVIGMNVIGMNVVGMN